MKHYDNVIDIKWAYYDEDLIVGEAEGLYFYG